MGGDSTARDNQNALSGQELALAQKQDGRADKMFSLSFPGLEKASDFYTKLSSGDPNLIAKSIAPATEQINQAGTAAKQNIRNTTPAGGEQRLAEDMTDASTAGQVGRTATQSYLSSFPALASLGQNGIGLSVNQVANAIAGMGASGQANQSVMQADAANKASTMGFLGSLGGAAGEVGAAAVP